MKNRLASLLLALCPTLSAFPASYNVNPSSLPPTVRINEVMASNGTTIADEDGDFEDWIELYNDGTEPVDLSGWGLSDSYSNPFKWTFPEDTVLEAGSYLLVWASGKDRNSQTELPGLLREVWTGIPGASVESLTSDPRYPDQPDAINRLIDFLEAPTNIDDNYGQRIQGVLIPPQSGSYRFWIASDDNGELWLSTDENPVNVVLIAAVPGWTSPRQWDKYAAQGSGVIHLQAGERYFLKAYMKEATGGDNLAVRWQLPDGIVEEPIPAFHFTQQPGGEIHTNFRISSAGEPLVLTRPDGQTVDAMEAVPIPQDFSYGRASGGDGSWQYFATPTPGSANAGAAMFFPPSVSMSEPRGFKTAPFPLALAAGDPEAVIRFTLDGSTPDATSPIYQGPFTIDRTTVVRAAVVAPDLIPLPPTTATYLFLDDVLAQDATPPPNWPADREINNKAIFYGLRPEIVAGDNARLRSGMTAIPSISLVTDLDNLFHPETGIYVNSNRSHGWERPASVELIDPEGRPEAEFQIDAGLRLRGGHSRRVANPKNSLRFVFRSVYGESSLNFPLFGDEGTDSFERVDLRTDQNHSWSGENSRHNTFLREVFSRDTQRDMGMPYTRSRYYHLYINGQYWGLYMTQERANADFAASYLGGDRDDWDRISTGQPGYATQAGDGNFLAWSQLHTIAVGQGFAGAQADNYWRLRGLHPDGTPNPDFPVLLDEDNLINLMLISHFVGDRDSPASAFFNPNRPNNMHSLFNRRAPTGFKWLRHDAEHSLGVPESVTWDNTYLGENFVEFDRFGPATLHWQLTQHPEYRMRLADLMQRHLFGDGALAPESAKARVQRRMAEIDLAIIAESARWGRGRTRDGDWIPATNAVLDFLDQRRDIFVQQYRARGWFPQTEAPQVRVAGDAARISASSTFHYMVDGSDPRLVGGAIHPQARTVQLDEEGQSETVLVSRGAVWRFFDGGMEPPVINGLTWRDPGYPDGPWASGPGILGFAGASPQNPVATPTRRWIAGTSGPQVITTYFRHTFELEEGIAADQLFAEILRDDGAIIYLNGVEILRENMPGGPVNYGTFASQVVGGADQVSYFARNLDVADLLQPGLNTLAAEVHQVNANSSDLYFDFSLTVPLMASKVLPLREALALKVRAKNNGEWSPLVEFSSREFLPDPVAVHAWDFEHAASFQNDGTLILPSATIGNGLLAIEPGTHPDWEAISNTGGDFATRHLRVNFPLGTTLTFSLPTTGFEAITFDFLTRRSGQGAEHLFVEYTLDGETWTSALDEPDFLTVFNAPPQAQSFDFSAVPGVSDNADFAVRFTFAQGADGGTAGNNRFDDVILSGVALPETNLPPVVLPEAPEVVELAAERGRALDLDTWFADPEEDALSFSVVSLGGGVASADIVGSVLILTGLLAGEGSVVVSASDGQNPPVTHTARLLVYGAPHAVASGDFVFSEWDPLTPAGVFPANMLFVQSNVNDPDLAEPLLFAYSIAGDAHADDDAALPYNATSRTRLNGLGEAGISFINTGRGRDLGGAVLSLNTTGASDVRVSFTAGTVLANSRIYGLRLQYRVGLSGEWADVTDGGLPVEYVRSTDGDAVEFAPIFLPSAVANEALVQLRWKYHHISGTSGPRAMLRLDDIVVTSGEVGATPPVRFGDWVSLEVTNPADQADPTIAGPKADPTGSGVTNLERYAFGLSLTEAPWGRLPRLLSDGTEFVFPLDLTLTDLTYRVRSSADLEDWGTIEYDSRVDSFPLPVDGWLSLPLGQDLPRFFRLELILEPFTTKPLP
jgi:hypothetical protein